MCIQKQMPTQLRCLYNVQFGLVSRGDAFKLCYIHQRPFAQSVANIGSWQTAMEVMGVIGQYIRSMPSVVLWIHAQKSCLTHKLQLGLHITLPQ